MPLYIKSLGIGIFGWSLLASALAVGMFLAEWVWGSLSDRIDRRLLMLVSVLSLGVLSLLYTVHELVPFFMILMFTTGALIVAIGPLTRSYVSSESPIGSIGLYTSLWWTFLVFGRVVGPILGTYIAQTWAFEYSFWATSAISFTLALFILASLPSETRNRQPVNSDMIDSLKVVLSKRSARLLFLSAMFYFMAPALTLFFLPLYASQQIKMSTVNVGILIASVSGAELVSMPIIGWLSDKYGRKRTTLVGLLASSVLFLLYFIARTPSQVLLVSMAVGVGFSGTSLLLAMIPEVTPAAMRGATIGVYGSFEDLASIIAPLLFGFVWDAFGPIYIFAVASITQLIGVFLVYGIHEKSGK